MSAEGFFAFTQKIDPQSFKVFCAILAEGDVAKASRQLAMPDSTGRKMVREWSTHNEPAYQTLVDLVDWRKEVGGKQTIPFNPEIFHERQQTTNYQALLSDVLDGLASMTPGNWEDECSQLADLLRPY